MKNKKKLLFVSSLITMLIISCLCGCSLTMDDFSNIAKENAEQMADDMMENLENFDVENFIDKDALDGLENSFSKENLIGPYKVIRVVDGDTFVAEINGQETKVRMIGVDTPESVATGKNAYKNCEEGKEASNYTKSLIDGNMVYLEYDVDPDDNYGRTLAYVYLEDGTMLNNHLLEKGYARMMTIEPNVKYVDTFKQTQTTARENKVGFWDGFETWEE